MIRKKGTLLVKRKRNNHKGIIRGITEIMVIKFLKTKKRIKRRAPKRVTIAAMKPPPATRNILKIRTHPKGIKRVIQGTNLPAMNKVLICLLFVLTACESNTLYHSYQPISHIGWSKEDTLLFQIPDTLVPGTYEFQIGIRHLESYPYRDIWLAFCHNLQDSTFYQTDTLHLYLADLSGAWQGDGIGGLIQYNQQHPEYWVQQDSASNRSIIIYHLMSDSILKSIHDVGIKINVCSEPHQSVRK